MGVSMEEVEGEGDKFCFWYLAISPCLAACSTPTLTLPLEGEGTQTEGAVLGRPARCRNTHRVTPAKAGVQFGDAE
ncbi:hypothetical protein SAMN02745223_03268 [Devosia limi DSM 17137]|uniref:Uncharacterized protein n=1 Tax=Devosia limi DSM 17137 TaxID=1121477 RepID=A0A1M5DJG1_9HYPH|nr:hypothetical protein SAMN02745223_03268 [Devosia limi DSM 17137]